jgi:CheY-like chemotaxis protein
MTNTILLADDSVTIQKVIELTFMDEDYEVVAVGNGDEALDRLEQVTPDVVIADVYMPGASGYDVAKRAKQLHPQAPVLLLVGTFEPFDEADYEASGADAYLKKPFDSQELLQRVSELMAVHADLTLEGGAAAEPPPAPAVAEESGAVAEGLGSGLETGEADRFAPSWDDEKTDSWRVTPAAGGPPAADGDEAGEDDELGTRRVPTFGGEEVAPEIAAVSEPAWSGGWSAAEEPAEPGPASEDEEAAYATGDVWPAESEAWEPPAESLESWPSAAGDETGPAGEEGEAEPASAAAAPAEDAVEVAPAAVAPEAPTGHAGEPFPELARPAAATAAEGAVSGVGEPAPASGPVAGGGPMSEDDVDRVARRVVELLGDRVVREVAWEVVPDLAEVVIKDRLRELESQID